MVTLEDAKVVARHLVRTVDPICIIVFGSVAVKGKGEDLDLLVVMRDEASELEILFEKVHRHLKPFLKEFAIDPFVLPRSKVISHFLKGSSFLRLVQRDGRCLYMKESVKLWIKQAHEDLSVARYLLDGEYFREACYYGQQAIEKIFKGALLQKGWELEKIHNIERLIALGERYDVSFDISEDDAVFIDSVYRGRYPAEEGLLPTGEPDLASAERIVKIAEAVCQKLPVGS